MMNLLYAGNAYVFDGILTSSLSAVMRMKDEEEININILTMDLQRLKDSYVKITQKQADFIENALRKYNKNAKVILHDVTDLYGEHLAFNANEDCYCSPYTLLRLLADLLGFQGKLLYLDADVMFNKDPRLIYNIDTEGAEYCAARDHYGKFLINPNYINAGVLLFDMDVCRESGIFEKARKLIREVKLTFADQSALIRSTTKRKIISQRFNDQKFLYKNTVIRHFSKRLFYLPYPHTENLKQWQVDKVRKKFGYKEFDDIFDEYLLLKEKYENDK